MRRVASTVLRGGDTVTYALLPDSRKHGFGWEGWSSNTPLDPNRFGGV